MSSTPLFGCGTHNRPVGPLLCSERSSLHLLADVLIAALRCHLPFHGSVAHRSHNCITGNCSAHTKQSQLADRIETLLVAEIYFLLEKLSFLFTLWLSRLKSEAHGEREESAVVI